MKPKPRPKPGDKWLEWARKWKDSPKQMGPKTVRSMAPPAEREDMGQRHMKKPSVTPTVRVPQVSPRVNPEPVPLPRLADPPPAVLPPSFRAVSTQTQADPTPGTDPPADGPKLPGTVGGKSPSPGPPVAIGWRGGKWNDVVVDKPVNQPISVKPAESTPQRAFQQFSVPGGDPEVTPQAEGPYCPLVGQGCLGPGCAFFSVNYQQCSFLMLAEYQPNLDQRMKSIQTMLIALMNPD